MAPLFIAIREDNLKLAKHILAKTGNKNPSGPCGHTALHYAVSQFEMFRLIFENVEVPAPVDNFGRTPLHIAAEDGLLAICWLIVEKVEDKNPADKYGDTPLHLAARSRLAPKYWAANSRFKELIELFQE